MPSRFASTPFSPPPPASDEESVWDYPRPPRAEPTPAHVRVVFNDITIAETRHAVRVLETSHPPVYYIPREDVQMQYLELSNRTTFCEWKGHAAYYGIQVGEQDVADAAWSFLEPMSDYAEIRGYIAFYASKMEACFVDDMRVKPQEGDFYGGWITEKIIGPFKGGPGTWGW